MKTLLLFLLAVSLQAQTASLLPPVKAQFLNDDGTPMVGGKICTYTAGTTTPQQTFTDQTLSTPNSNPTILDARGEANIWLSSAAPYKVVLRRPGGVTNPFVTACSDTPQVYSVDFVQNASGGGGGGGGGGGSTLPVTDDTPIVKNLADNTKLVRVSAALVSPFTTRVLTMQNQNLTVAGIDVPQTFTQTQTLAADLIPSVAGSWNVGTVPLPFSTAVFVQYYARTAGGLCNYAGMVANVTFGGTITAQNSFCATQAQMNSGGFDTVGLIGAYKVQGIDIVTPDRNLRNIASVSTSLIPTATNTYHLGDSSAFGYWATGFISYINADIIEPKSTGSTMGANLPGSRWNGHFQDITINSTIKFKATTIAGWILTAVDTAGNADWQAPPTGTLPSQTGNAGKYLTTDGTNPSWGPISGAGISSLNLQTGLTQTFGDDANVKIVSATNNHQLTWAGTLAGTRGGLGVNAGGFSGVLRMVAGVGSVVPGAASDCVHVDASSSPCAGGSGVPFGDATYQLNNSIDGTKRVQMGAGLISPGTTRFIAFPNGDTTLAGLAIAQTFTQPNTFQNILSQTPDTHTIGSPGNRFATMYGRVIDLISTTTPTTAQFYVRRFSNAGLISAVETGAGAMEFTVQNNSVNKFFVGDTQVVIGPPIFANRADMQSTATVTGRVRVLNQAGTKIGAIQDTGSDVELSIINTSTDFLVNSSVILFGHTATTQSLLPNGSFLYNLGSPSARYTQTYGRILDLQAQNSSFMSLISLRQSAAQVRLSLAADDTVGAELHAFSAAGGEFFGFINGQLRYNNQPGFTGTLNLNTTTGPCAVTYNQGAVTAAIGSGC